MLLAVLHSVFRSFTTYDHAHYNHGDHAAPTMCNSFVVAPRAPFCSPLSWCNMPHIWLFMIHLYLGAATHLHCGSFLQYAVVLLHTAVRKRTYLFTQIFLPAIGPGHNQDSAPLFSPSSVGSAVKVGRFCFLPALGTPPWDPAVGKPEGTGFASFLMTPGCWGSLKGSGYVHTFFAPCYKHPKNVEVV